MSFDAEITDTKAKLEKALAKVQSEVAQEVVAR